MLLGSPPDMVHGAPSHGAHPLYAEQRSTALSGSAAALERRVIALIIGCYKISIPDFFAECKRAKANRASKA